MNFWFFELHTSFGLVTMTSRTELPDELPTQLGPTTMTLNSPSKNSTGSMPSTDEESAYMDDEEGVEIDDLATLLVEHKARETIEEEPVVEKSTHKKKKNKGKKKSFRLFAKKVKKEKSSKKKSSKAAAPQAAIVTPPPSPPNSIPALVETKSFDGDVSTLTPVGAEDKSVKIEEKAPITPDEKAQPEPIVITDPSPDPTESKVEAEEQADLSDLTTQDSKPVTETQVTPLTVPFHQDESDETVEDMDDEDEGVEIAAAGISRMWALFFHHEEEVNEASSVESNQGSDVGLFPRAIPASDLPLSEIARLASQDNSLAMNVESLSLADALEEPEELVTTEAEEEPVTTEAKNAEEPAKISTPSSPKRKWGLFSQRNKAVADECKVPAQDSNEDSAIPLSDLSPSEIAGIGDTAPKEDASTVAEEESAAESSLARESEAVDEQAEKSSDSGSLFTNLNMTLAALTGSNGSVEVSVPEEDSCSETETETATRSMVIPQEDPQANSHERGDFFAPLNATLDATLAAWTGSVAVPVTGDVKVSASELTSRMAAEEDPILASRSVNSSVASIPEAVQEGEEKAEPQENPAVVADADTGVSDKGRTESFDDTAPREGVSTKTEEPMQRTTISDVDIQSNVVKETGVREKPSASAGIFAAALAALAGSVSVQDSGSVEVAVPNEDAEVESETEPAKDVSSTNAPKEVVSTGSTEVGAEVATGTAKDDAPEELSVSSGIVARRKAHLSALADNISTHEGEASAEASAHDSSTDTLSKKKTPKRGFKAKLKSSISRVIAAKEESGVESDRSSAEHSLQRYKMAGDTSTVDESELDKQADSFFNQLEDKTIDENVDEELGLDVALSFPGLACFAQNARAFSPVPPDFDEQKFGEDLERQLCGALPPVFRIVDGQETESKLAAFIEAFDICGRPTGDTQDNSVDPGSEVALSGKGDSVREALDDLSVPFKLLEFFEESSLDESFWSALDESTNESDISDRSGSDSVRRFKQLLREHSKSSLQSSKTGSEKAGTVDDDTDDLDDSIFDTVCDTVEEASTKSEGLEVVPKPGSSDNAAADSSKENVAPPDDNSKENVSPTRSKKSSAQRSSDKAVNDIKRAMVTLKKHATRHGISEPELLWKIQEEHKKRKNWSATMAEF